MRKQPAVYMLSSQKNGTLYVGVTGELVRRVWQHKNNMVEGFSGRYGVHRLVWFELHDSMDTAISREKQIKNWQRRWKLKLIERDNPKWLDLYNSIV